jgi:adenylate cyclase
LPLPNKPSIAVLPFTNMSGDPQQEYFADGIVEDITTALSRFPSLFVIARNSSFTYKGRAVDIKQVGRELGVRYVLEGSVRKAGTRVRITGQLVQAETGAHVWAERYDNELVDIFVLQDEMTTSIVGALVPGMQRAEMDRVSQKPPESLDAYDCYLRAMAAFYTWTKEGNDRALQYLERGLALDPNFVAAVILCENCWGLRYTQGWSPVTEAVAESSRLARLAVQLDPNNAEALAVLSRRTASINHDYDEAMSLAEQAVSINPNSAFAWRHSGWAFLFACCPEQALMHFNRALRLSPRDPRAHDSLSGIALGLIQMERDMEAIAIARRAIQHNPNFASAWRMLAAALALNGQLDEAHAALRRVLALDSTCSLRTMYVRFGHSEKARARFYCGLRKAGMAD